MFCFICNNRIELYLLLTLFFITYRCARRRVNVDKRQTYVYAM